ncbi:hypothetical protein [Rheinheimera sp.]|uniref:hypothetical protein n=1 Tax=Rheinheimera sp. TaxID=1869214 RepID=UPI003D2E7FBF
MSDIEKEAIAKAYQANIAKMFDTLMTSYRLNSTPDEKKAALARFTDGKNLLNEALKDLGM